MILYKGVVTHVIDPSNFWMQMGTGKCGVIFEFCSNNYSCSFIIVVHVL